MVQNPTAAGITCGACGESNQADTKFCKGCGQALYEPCRGCTQQVSLTQKFCGACGADLEKAVEELHEQHRQWLGDAVASAKAYDFDHAMILVQRVAGITDYRFREAAQNATVAAEKITAMRDRATDNANRLLASAKAEFSNGNHMQVVRLLESIPERMLGDEAKKILSRVRSYTSEVTELDEGVRAAIADKNWSLVGGLVDQLLVHSPHDKQYRKTALQVSNKLLGEAEKYFKAGKYARAVEKLSAVPMVGRTGQFEERRQSYEDVEWLSRQFDEEAFATPMLGRIAVRFSKDVPDDARAEKRVKELSAELKQGERSPRNPFPRWRGSDRSWLGGRANLLGYPTSIDLGEQKLVKTCGSRFHVAIGLALQGLGHARITEQFCKKSRLSLGWRKKKPVWGIDIGAAAIKAICLEETESGIVAIDSYFFEFEEPLCRSSVQNEDRYELITAAVEKFADEKEITDSPVWSNISASDTVNRFVRLPPVGDKQANALMNTEIEQRVPVDLDELGVIRWIGPSTDDDTVGRPAAAAAAKQAVIDKQIELLAEGGLKVTGMQSDTVAIANFIAYEFAQLLEPDEEGEQEEGEEDEEIGADETEVADVSKAEKTPAIAVLECGASSTSLIIVSREAHWIWTIDTGGEDMTSALARSTKSTHSEAEQLKRNPATLEFPSKQYGPVEQRLEETRIRLHKVRDDALNQNSRFEIVESWCMGGGCLAHQWMRRLVLQSE